MHLAELQMLEVEALELHEELSALDVENEDPT